MQLTAVTPHTSISTWGGGGGGGEIYDTIVCISYL